MVDLTQLATGLLLGLAMAGGGYWRGALDRSGAIAAAVVGTLVFGLGGWPWGVLLVAFFVISSALSVYGRARKAEVAADKFSKGGRRDWAQVLANGGWLTLLALLIPFQPGASWLFPAATGALAAVTADTWATELGTLSNVPPRLITTGRTVPPGTNGGVTLLGTTAAIVGGLFIGSLASSLGLIGMVPDLDVGARWLVPIAGAAGLAGAMVDSLLGATVQQVYHCPLCDSETERERHDCGTATHTLRGWSWMDNDMVNFLASTAGSLAAVWLALLAA